MKQVIYPGGLDWSALGDPQRNALLPFRHVIDPQNAPRKGIYAATAPIIGGTSQSAMYQHGPDFLAPLGPYFPHPLRILSNHIAPNLEQIHADAGADKLLKGFATAATALGGVAAGEPATDAADSEGDELQSVLESWPIHLPDPNAYAQLECAIVRLASSCSDLENWSTNRVRFALILLLTWEGVPLRNLRKYCAYYSSRCLVKRTDRDEWYFVAAMRQADLGIGLMPIRLRRFAREIIELAKRLEKKQPGGAFTDPRRSYQSGDLDIPRVPSLRAMGGVLARRLEADPAGSLTPERAMLELTRATELHAAYHLGPLLATGLLDKLIIPPNYYCIEDLLREPGRPAALVDIQGNPWVNPYVPSDRDLRREKQRAAILRSLPHIWRDQAQSDPAKPKPRGQDKRRRGPTPQLAPILRPLSATPFIDWPEADQVRFFELYMPFPDLSNIRRILELHGLPSANRAAKRILKRLRQRGKLHCGRPLRLIHPEEQLPLLTKLTERMRPKNEDGTECRLGDKPYPKFCRPALGAQSMAVGSRLNESIQGRRDDLYVAGKLRLLEIHGTKTARAHRVLNLDLFARGPGGPEIVELFLAERARLTPEGACAKDGFLYGDPERGSKTDSEEFSSALEACLQELIGPATAPSSPDARKPRSARIYGRATHHTLRHAAPLRVIQGLLDEGVHLHGDFFGSVAELAKALGHSLLTLLGSYIGTAWLVLRYPEADCDASASPNHAGQTPPQ